MPFASFMSNCSQRMESALEHWLPAESIAPTKLHQAMRYSVLNGGKHVRPALTYATGHTLGIHQALLDIPATAVELIHAYSLIHDDLPAMDDDDLRRGKATCHKAFDEATAILAGDALQALSFHMLAHAPDLKIESGARLKMVEILAMAAGSRGMAGGQAMDLAYENQDISVSELENMHIHKTGALIRASVQLGLLCKPGIDADIKTALDQFAKNIGLAFQVQDDILDVEGETDVLGKPAGSDEKLNKSTYVSLLGLREAKSMAEELYQQALHSLKPFNDNADPLRWLAEYIVKRKS